MLSTILICMGAVAAMVAILAFFSEDIKKGQKEIRDNFVSRRKTSLRKIFLNNEVDKELIKDINKGFFKKRKESIERLLFKADIKITYEEYMIICVLCGIIGYYIGAFLNNTMVSLIAIYFMISLPKSYLKMVSNSIKKQLDEQLEPVLSQIIGLLPTKKNLINACETCVENMEEPIKDYITEFINNVNNANRSFEEAINELARKIDSKPFYDFARLAIVHNKQGGETMYAFNSIPETMRDIKLIQSEQEAELDSLKLMGYMFTILGPAGYLYYYFTDKDNFSILVDSTVGKVITFLVIVITIITIKIIIKISRPVEL